jgi:hypothetical protein
MAHEKWSSSKYDEVQLSKLMWRPRDSPPKERYLPADYTLPKHHVIHPVTGEEETSTPKRKHRKSMEGEPSAKRKKRSAEADEAMSESEEGESSKPSSARKKSASKPKKSKALKEESTPSRGRLSRGAKGGQETTRS